ncbi:hypothetical protein DXG01_002330, partial [Tephrocybe rancida]
MYSTVQESDPMRFMLLEAEVADSGSEESEDEGEDDFLDSEPTTVDRTSSHRFLTNTMEQCRTEKDDEDWNLLLARAHHCATKDSSHVQDLVLDDLEPHIWGVSVKPGYEEHIAFVLLEKALLGGSVFSVASVIGRWIYVEAPNVDDVQTLCKNVSNVFTRRIEFISPEDALSCLKEPPLFQPRASSWIRLTVSPYRGDLAFVRQYNARRGAEVLVVPRVNLVRRIRRKLGNPDKGKRTSEARPAQALLREDYVKHLLGEQSVESKSTREFRFRSRNYVDGYLSLVMHKFTPHEILPLPSEISLFADSYEIPQELFKAASNRSAALQLSISDLVKVVE